MKNLKFTIFVGILVLGMTSAAFGQDSQGRYNIFNGKNDLYGVNKHIHASSHLESRSEKGEDGYYSVPGDPRAIKFPPMTFIDNQSDKAFVLYINIEGEDTYYSYDKNGNLTGSFKQQQIYRRCEVVVPPKKLAQVYLDTVVKRYVGEGSVGLGKYIVLEWVDADRKIHSLKPNPNLFCKFIIDENGSVKVEERE